MNVFFDQFFFCNLDESVPDFFLLGGIHTSIHQYVTPKLAPQEDIHESSSKLHGA